MTASTDTTSHARGAGPPEIVVPPDWLEERLGDPGLHLVDMRDESSYHEAHLPGAVRLDLARLGTAARGLDNVLLPAGPFTELMEELGITRDGVVVAYDDQWGLAAARLVWALHYYGHRAAAVLDGGWDRWTEEGRAVTDHGEPPPRGRFVAAPDAEVAAETDWLASRALDERVALVDTRSSAEFEAGHLPGAVSWDWFNAVPPGSWDVSRDASELKDEWSALGLDPGTDVVVYCRSGMRAAHTYIVLRRAGFPRVRLYDGSWQEWSMRQSGETEGV